MGGERPEEGAPTARKREVADQLRDAVAALAECDHSGVELDEIAALAKSLAVKLTGPHRKRWYEADPEETDLRTSYLDYSPIRGPYNAIAPEMTLGYVEGADGVRRVEGSARLGAAYEGPPHGVHGGWVAAIMDELLGFAQGLAGKHGVTATLKVRYRQVTPIDEDLRLSAWIHEDRGRAVMIRGTCHAGETLTAEAEGMFARIQFDEIRNRMRERRGDG